MNLSKIGALELVLAVTERLLSLGCCPLGTHDLLSHGQRCRGVGHTRLLSGQFPAQRLELGGSCQCRLAEAQERPVVIPGCRRLGGFPSRRRVFARRWVRSLRATA